MNEQIEKLYSIGNKNKRIIVGLMSGTSMDGLDIALCEFTGSGRSTHVSLLQFETVAYEAVYKQEVDLIFSKKSVDLEKICLLNGWIGNYHARLVNNCLRKWDIPNSQVDLIASHGQTIYHAPKWFHGKANFGNATLQIGDGDHIATTSGIITVSDFRQKNIAAGGEGAPLAAYGDYILFNDPNHNVMLLNIGGIANFTYIPAGAPFDQITCSDIGPGNTLMDAYVRQNFQGMSYDRNGDIGSTGITHHGLLGALKEDDFFKIPFPKTTGPEYFNLPYLENAMSKCGVSQMTPQDVIATLNEFSAVIICEAVNQFLKNDDKWFVSGGGEHNLLLQANIRKHAGRKPGSTAVNKILPDAKEAILFGLLANECIAGNGTNFSGGNKNLPAISMGKISFPN